MPAAQSASRGTFTHSSETAPDLARLTRWAGRPLIAFGLLLALLSKGCDAINLHNATRAAALTQTSIDQFDDDAQAKKLALQNEIKTIVGRDEAKPDERRKLDELRKQIAELEASSAKERNVKEAGEWHELRTAARNAKRTFAVNSYWHELFFVFAAVVLVLGLLIVSWCAEGAERWTGLVMLAIVTYGLFVGSSGWLPTPG
jgi:hypothetical protein